jgi:hypothetical protein
MKTKKKARVRKLQFWINFKLGPKEGTSQNCLVDMLERKNYIHVVDHDSYQQLLSEAKKLRDEMSKCFDDYGYGSIHCRHKQAIESFDRFLEKGE